MLDRKSDPMQSSGQVTLDFSALHLWWKNGNPQADPKSIVNYFGGWCAHREDADKTLTEMQRTIPPTFQPFTYHSSDNKPYDVYATRVVAVTPILKRSRWFTDRDTNRPYNRTEILVMMATIDIKAKAFVPWGPVVLSGSSYSGVAITDALAGWRRKIERFCNDAKPVWAHWVVLGTVRDTIYTELRGKGTKQSPITPCEISMPADVSQQFVEGRYIGDQLMGSCVEYRLMSQDWAASWNDYKGEITASPENGDQPGNKNQPQPTTYQPEPDPGNIPF